MPYWDIVTRSFRIPWNHKYIWLIALFSGEAGAGFNLPSAQPRPAAIGSGRAPDFGGVQQQIGAGLAENAGLILLLVVLWLGLLVGFFILAAACEGATVRAAAEHDAERPFDLGAAWRAGVARMGVIIRFRLLLVALSLPVFLVLFGLVIGAVAAGFTNHVGLAIGLAVIAVLIFVAAIPYAIYLSFLDRFGTRAAVLELLAARASLARAHRLLLKRFGRALLVWLLSIAVAIVVGLCQAVVGALLSLPLALLAFGASNGFSPVWIAIGALFVVLLPIAVILFAFQAAQSSTYWTLAFRRMDVEFAVQPYPPAAS